MRRLSLLAAPVVLTQVGTMLLGFVDLLMVGHLEGRAAIEGLGAISLGRIWVMSTVVLGMGIVFGIDPIVSQARGARDPRRMGIALQQALVVAGLSSLPIGALWLVTRPALLAMGQDPLLSSLAHEYVLVQLPSLPLFLWFLAARQWLQGRAIVLPAMWVIVIANLLNVLINWLLVFGHWGFPALGVLGAGIATALTQGFMLVALVAWGWLFQLQRGAWVGWSASAFDPRGLREIVHFGWPVAIQLALEMWVFQASTVMAGLLGELPLAAHTIVMNLSSISFMVPLGLAIATVTRVGNLIGARNPHAAQRAAWVALALGAGTMAAFSLLFVVGRFWLPGWYTAELPVIALAAATLPVAAAFQLVDGLQVVGGGVLRGMGSTRPAALFNLVGYYGFALPLGWWLAFERGMGLAGIWWGLALGLATVAALLLAWIAVRGPAHATPVV